MTKPPIGEINILMTPTEYESIRTRARAKIEAQTPEPVQEFDSVDALMEALTGEEPREAV